MPRVLVRVALVVAIALLLLRLTRQDVAAPVDDFISYWSAARIVAEGGNPYDLEALLAQQRSAGWRYSRPLPVWPAAMQAAAAHWTRADRVFWIVLNGTALGIYPLLRYRQIWYLLYPIALLVWWRSRRATKPTHVPVGV